MSKTRFPIPTSLAVVLLTLLMVALFWVFRPQQAPLESYSNAPLPWNIQRFDDGSSQVFHIHLGQSVVHDLLQTLGEDYEMAIISDEQDQSGLEIYYSDFMAGPIKGKLIARINAATPELVGMQERASKSSYTDSGSRKFVLSAEDLQRVQSWPIVGLSFTPQANLDAAVITARFGKPDQQITTGEGEEVVQHYLYPQLGLHIAQSEKSKELLQYIAPRDFHALSEPLQPAH